MLRLVTCLIRFPLAIYGEVIDRLFGPDELGGCSWPNTTPSPVERRDAGCPAVYDPTGPHFRPLELEDLVLSENDGP